MEMDTLQYSYVANVNAGSREAYEQLSAEGIPEIYYLSREELNLSMDSWVDLVHPNDFGMSQYANVVEMKVRDILNIPSSTSSTTCPVTQRRCVDYEWLDRHLKIVDLVCKKETKKPLYLVIRLLIIGEEILVVILKMVLNVGRKK